MKRSADYQQFESLIRSDIDLNNTEFRLLRDFIYSKSGIALSPIKRQLLASRLAKRLRYHGLKSYKEYFDLLQNSHSGSAELQEMINCVTTNKTDFFREPHHFDFLRDVAIPAWNQKYKRDPNRSVRIWCSASSTGPEPYSIAMTVREHLDTNIRIEIIASDIDTHVLSKAKAGIYTIEEVGPVSQALLRKHFLLGYGDKEGYVQVREEIRRLISFRQINLISPVWDLKKGFDAIFCRNVMIYFDRETQKTLVDRFSNNLVDGGYLFLGHSENLFEMSNRLTPLGNTIYRSSRPSSESDSKSGVSTSNYPSINVTSIIAGEQCVCREPTMIHTILGSCVAVCLYDPVAKVGGMNHFLLPGEDGEDQKEGKYGLHSIEMLIRQVVEAGASRGRLKAKVFGGGHVVHSISAKTNVGALNSIFVIDYLVRQKIPIVSRLLGEPNGLRVHFQSDTGQVWVKALSSSDSRDD